MVCSIIGEDDYTGRDFMAGRDEIYNQRDEMLLHIESWFMKEYTALKDCITIDIF